MSQGKDLYKAVVDMFTCPVELPSAPDSAIKGTIWWEDRGNGWLYPWRITGAQQGYPCGTPAKKETL